MVESKPEGNKPDLRISQPWPELLEYCQSIDFDEQVRSSFVLSCVIFLHFLYLFSLVTGVFFMLFLCCFGLYDLLVALFLLSLSLDLVW